MALYSVRFSVQAQQDIIEATSRFDELTGDIELATAWGQGVYEEATKLSAFPRSYAVAELETRRFGLEVRSLSYRRPGSTVAYRLLYIVEDESDDGPRVTILHVRHAARAPTTREEARRILVNL